jgi:hypothetical protein
MILEQTGFNYAGAPHNMYASTESPQKLVAAILKTAFRMAGGTLNRS